MADRHPHAERALRAYASERSEEFTATLLADRVYEQVQGQHGPEHAALPTLLDLSERAYQLSEGTVEPVSGTAFDAAETLVEAVDAAVANQIARACATIVTESDDWTDVHPPAEVHAAQAEAREWLTDHREAAERVGVLEDVREVQQR